mmetsp:Transcript_16971/g.26482  ORF Transcript_16971/g.26482 Transcript_16971/m.26482 type:complete len:233 (-) Transcript_16971:4784-5482(-)
MMMMMTTMMMMRTMQATATRMTTMRTRTRRKNKNCAAFAKSATSTSSMKRTSRSSRNSVHKSCNHSSHDTLQRMMRMNSNKLCLMGRRRTMMMLGKNHPNPSNSSAVLRTIRICLTRMHYPISLRMICRMQVQHPVDAWERANFKSARRVKSLDRNTSILWNRAMTIRATAVWTRMAMMRTKKRQSLAVWRMNAMNPHADALLAWRNKRPRRRGYFANSVKSLSRCSSLRTF